MTARTAAALVIGNELLSGKVKDENTLLDPDNSSD